LHGQNSLLERDINKRDSLAGRRRDSIVERGSKMFDPKRPKGLAISLEQTLQVLTLKLEYLMYACYNCGYSFSKPLTPFIKYK